jgi:hypothetical protein
VTISSATKHFHTLDNSIHLLSYSSSWPNRLTIVFLIHLSDGGTALASHGRDAHPTSFCLTFEPRITHAVRPGGNGDFSQNSDLDKLKRFPFDLYPELRLRLAGEISVRLSDIILRLCAEISV